MSLVLDHNGHWRKECPSSAGAPKLIYGPGIDYPDLICAVLLFIEAADIQLSHFLMLHTLTWMYLHRNPIAENNISRPWMWFIDSCAQWTQYTWALIDMMEGKYKRACDL